LKHFIKAVESYKKNGKKGKKMKIKSDYLHFITCGTFIWIINSWSAEDVSVFFHYTGTGNLALKKFANRLDKCFLVYAFL